MDVGLTIPTRGPLATPQGVEAFARRAGDLHYAHLAVPDHVVVPRSIDSRYPYSASGEFPGAASGACFDQFTLLAYVAAINTTARLLTSVTVIPHRGAVHTAKTVSTIDVLSQGRMILGVGAGWMKEEFEALGAPAFEERGRVTDEYLQVFKLLWTEDDPHFEGNHVRFANISFLPKPVQHPPPAYLGGRRKPGSVAPHGPLRRHLVSHRQQPAPSPRYSGSLRGRLRRHARHRGAAQSRSGKYRTRVFCQLVRREQEPQHPGRASPHFDW